ncbi:ABC transporter substrate-binding protein [Pseudomonas aeruginosa]|nr:ABC transporter substrate-binding protein [Pseudomonas aeruginosa]
MPGRILVFACCLLASLARSEPRHAITLYDEPAKYPPGFQHFDFVDPQAPKGGSLRRMESGSFDTLNPFANRGTPISMTQAALIYETLGFQSLDEPFTEYGYLARYIEKAPDNSWVRFHIDPRARFSDGVAVTAEDVKFSFDSLVEQGSPFWRAYYKEVREPVVEDRLRIRFDFRHAGNRELPLVLAQLYVLPRHWWQGRDFNRSSMQPPLGSGPYRLEKAPYPYPASLQGLVFNLRRPLFEDRRVRQALSLLFDFEWTNRQLFGGRYKRLRSYFDNSEMAARGLPGADELALLEPLRGQIPEEVFGQAYAPPVNDGSGDIHERLVQAYRLLGEAGWHAIDGRLLDTAGRPLRFELLLQGKGLERALLPFQRNLARIGIDMRLRQVDASQYIERIRARDYDMIVSSFSQSNSPGNEQYSFWHSSSYADPGGYNRIGLKDPAIDRLVQAVVEADSRAALETAVRALDRVLQWGYYLIPTWYSDEVWIASWNRFGRPPQAPRYSLGLNTWWEVRERAVPSREAQ